MSHTFRLGCDIGGTFTDFVLVNDATGEVFLEKCLTTPDDPCRGVIDGVRLLEARVPGYLARATRIVHGTTLVINTILEFKGARTGLLTTAGFRDVIEMRREQRYDKFDLFQHFPKPLVPRRLRLGVEERTRADGSIVQALDEGSLATAVEHLRRESVDAVAVCFLHSYANPSHEQAAAKFLAERLPNAVVSLSSEVLPHAKEYERFSTTVINAYVQPRVSTYLEDLESRLSAEGFRGELFLMNSEGGLTTARTARRFPVRIVESGPAGGVIATERLTTRLGIGNLLSFDMGGTTAKVAVVENGRAAISSDYEVAREVRFKRGSGYHIEAPTVDLLEVGSGGGSIAQVNRFGLLQVGPESASSVPGPAAYGKGGENPTVTDADLLLGYLDAKSFLGGRMELDVEAARTAARSKLGEPLDLTAEAAAWGIYEVVSENMAAAARAYLLERGEDPTSLAMVTYGGAGPVHGLRVAQKLGVRTVVVPPATGTFSALGFLEAEPAIRLTQSFRSRLDKLNWEALSAAWSALSEQAKGLLPSRSQDDGELRIELGGELRYFGQGYTVNVRVPPVVLTQQDSKALLSTFEQEYERLYGRTSPDTAVEITTVWLRASIVARLLDYRPPSNSGSAGRHTTRPVYFPEAGAYVETIVRSRYDLAPGSSFPGPLIVEEVESTTVVPPGATLTVHESGALIVVLPEGDAA